MAENLKDIQQQVINTMSKDFQSTTTDNNTIQNNNSLFTPRTNNEQYAAYLNSAAYANSSAQQQQSLQNFNPSHSNQQSLNSKNQNTGNQMNQKGQPNLVHNNNITGGGSTLNSARFKNSSSQAANQPLNEGKGMKMELNSANMLIQQQMDAASKLSKETATSLQNYNQHDPFYSTRVDQGPQTSRIEESFFNIIGGASGVVQNNLGPIESHRNSARKNELFVSGTTTNQSQQKQPRNGGSGTANESRRAKYQNNSTNAVVDLNDITPELAATVVREYLLPMFEKENRKTTREKRRGDMSVSPSGGGGFNNTLEVGGVPNTVYGELKLSERLSLEILELRKEKELQREMLEDLQLRNDILEQKIAQLSQESTKQKSMIKQYKSQAHKISLDRSTMFMEVDKLKRQVLELQGLTTINEQNRKLFKIKQKSKISLMETEILGDQLKRLYDAFVYLGEGKKHGDKVKFELDQLQKKFNDMVFEKDINNSELQSALVERDKYRNEVKEVVRTLKKHQEDKEKMMGVLKERFNQLDTELKVAEGEAKKWLEEYTKEDKQVKALQGERDKMRQRILKLKNRRNFNINQKICKLCAKEYLEKENFNWSCRTHRSEFGGEMWWCCGKTAKDAPGCKFTKHESKEDEDEEGGEGGQLGTEQGAHLKNRYARCFCCKEKGHVAAECPRDPNMKTQRDVNEEITRIIKAKGFKKLLSDSLPVTSRFFKGLIKRAPGVVDSSSNPFSVGAMGFDDYSYKLYNDLIFNPKALKQINDEDTQMIMAANRNNGNGGNDDNESILTVENVKEFENSIPMDGDGMSNFMSNPVSVVRHNSSLRKDHEGATNMSGTGINNDEDRGANKSTLQLNISSSNMGNHRPQNSSNHDVSSSMEMPSGFKHSNTQLHGKNKGDDEANSQENDEDEDNGKELSEAGGGGTSNNVKLTYHQIAELRQFQDKDLFDDVQGEKLVTKIAGLQNKNLIDIADYIRELRYQSMQKQGQSRRMANSRQRGNFGGAGGPANEMGSVGAGEEWQVLSFNNSSSGINKDSIMDQHNYQHSFAHEIGSAHGIGAGGGGGGGISQSNNNYQQQHHGSKIDEQKQNQILIEEVERMFEGNIGNTNAAKRVSRDTKSKQLQPPIGSGGNSDYGTAMNGDQSELDIDMQSNRQLLSSAGGPTKMGSKEELTSSSKDIHKLNKKKTIDKLKQMQTEGDTLTSSNKLTSMDPKGPPLNKTSRDIFVVNGDQQANNAEKHNLEQNQKDQTKGAAIHKSKTRLKVEPADNEKKNSARGAGGGSKEKHASKKEVEKGAPVAGMETLMHQIEGEFDQEKSKVKKKKKSKKKLEVSLSKGIKRKISKTGNASPNAPDL